MTDIKKAINYFEYGIKCDIFQEPVTSYAKAAISALEKQIEIEKAQFTHICKSDRDYYPTTFSIYSRLIDENEDSVTIDRYQKFGALPIGKITISKKDFERYYKRIDKK